MKRKCMVKNTKQKTAYEEDIQASKSISFGLGRIDASSGFATRTQNYETFFMLNSTEHEITTAHKNLNGENEAIFLL